LQDYDGSHIKGLLINFIHFFWPSLLKLPGFLTEFITPIVRVSDQLHYSRTRTMHACTATVNTDYVFPDFKIKEESIFLHDAGIQSVG
jgi:DNA gyrase/topoisomerase IV subunit B